MMIWSVNHQHLTVQVHKLLIIFHGMIMDILQSVFHSTYALFVQLTNCWSILAQTVIPLAVIEIAV